MWSPQPWVHFETRGILCTVILHLFVVIYVSFLVVFHLCGSFAFLYSCFVPVLMTFVGEPELSGAVAPESQY